MRSLWPREYIDPDSDWTLGAVRGPELWPEQRVFAANQITSPEQLQVGRDYWSNHVARWPERFTIMTTPTQGEHGWFVVGQFQGGTRNVYLADHGVMPYATGYWTPVGYLTPADDAESE